MDIAGVLSRADRPEPRGSRPGEGERSALGDRSKLGDVLKVLVQWATAHVADWHQVDSAAWSALPKKSLPVGGEEIDAAPGWVNRLNVQGVEFIADHYAVEHLPDGCRVTAWYDDPDDYPPDEFYARVWTFLTLAPDERLKGRFNTRQSQVVYAAPDLMARLLADAPYENTELRPWTEFVPPDDAVVRHGVWMPKDLYLLHEARASKHGWRDWTEGVPPEFVRAGKVVG